MGYVGLSDVLGVSFQRLANGAGDVAQVDLIVGAPDHFLVDSWSFEFPDVNTTETPVPLWMMVTQRRHLVSTPPGFNVVLPGCRLVFGRYGGKEVAFDIWNHQVPEGETSPEHA